jgi:Flp pilus assembly protein TadB
MRDEEHVGRQDGEALLETRRELGPTYDAALVDSFADRIERVVKDRVDSQVEERRRALARAGDSDSKQLALGIVSMVAAIPISIVLGLTGHLLALLVAWIGIVGVNVAYALRSRLRR